MSYEILHVCYKSVFGMINYMRYRFADSEIIRIFRLILVFRLALTVFFVLAIRIPHTVSSLPGTFIVDAIVLIVYLYINQLRKLLGKRFIIIGLVLASVIPILEQYSRLYLNQNYLAWLTIAGGWQLFILLLIPMLFISVGYRFRISVAYAIATSSLEIVLIGVIGHGHMLGIVVIVAVLIRSFIYILIAYIVSRFVTVQQQQADELHLANLQLRQYAIMSEELATSRERNRLARELHDTLSHTLSASTIQVEAIDTIWESNPQQAHEMLATMRTTLRDGLSETRRALKSLRSSTIEDMGLELAVRHLVTSIQERHLVKVELTLDGHWDNVPVSVSQCVYRVVQEALNNVVQHSQASLVTIDLRRVKRHITLEIKDNGHGFDLKDVDTNAHFGIIGMKERVRMINGQFTLESSMNAGTKVCLQVEG